MIIYHSGPDHRYGVGFKLKTEVNTKDGVVHLSRVIDSKLHTIELTSDSFEVISNVIKLSNFDFEIFSEISKNLKEEFKLV